MIIKGDKAQSKVLRWLQSGASKDKPVLQGLLVDGDGGVDAVLGALVGNAVRGATAVGPLDGPGSSVKNIEEGVGRAGGDNGLRDRGRGGHGVIHLVLDAAAGRAGTGIEGVYPAVDAGDVDDVADEGGRSADGGAV